MDSPNPSIAPWNSELEAMRAVAEALDALDDDARRRVLTWASDRFGLHVTPSAHASSNDSDRDEPGAGGSGLDESALDLPSEAELYTGAPERLNAGDSLEDLIVHCGAVDHDGLAVGADLVEPAPEADLTIEIPEAVPALAASRLDLQSLLRGLVDEFDALVKAWQREMACAA